MPGENPLISVIIPAFNSQLYLREAIDSVLEQTYRPLELLVVDDGSTDGTADIARSYHPQVKYHYQPNAGSSVARNQGVRLSSGEFLAFLDHDDLWAPEKLELQMRRFRQNPSLEAVFVHVQQFYSPDLRPELRQKIYCPPDPQPGYICGMMLIRRQAFLRCGFFEPHWQIGETMSWYVNAKDKGLRHEILPETLYRRRLHAANKGIQLKGQRAEIAQILKASLDRRRRAQAAVPGEKADQPVLEGGEQADNAG